MLTGLKGPFRNFMKLKKDAFYVQLCVIDINKISDLHYIMLWFNCISI